MEIIYYFLIIIFVIIFFTIREKLENTQAVETPITNTNLKADNLEITKNLIVNGETNANGNILLKQGNRVATWRDSNSPIDLIYHNPSYNIVEVGDKRNNLRLHGADTFLTGGSSEKYIMRTYTDKKIEVNVPLETKDINITGKLIWNGVDLGERLQFIMNNNTTPPTS